MLPLEVSTILLKLQALRPRALFLLGGSVERGDASSASDVDFYCVAPLYKLLLLRPFICQVLTTKSISANCMLVPQFFFNRGWYYINGVDCQNVRHSSTINPSVIIRNCLIFALFHYALYLASENSQEKSKELAKSCQQLSALIRFQVKNFVEVSFANSDLAPYALGLTPESIPTILKQMYESIKPRLAFTHSAFWLYNLHFLRQGLFLNFRLNPAILVIEKLLIASKQQPDDTILKNLKSIIFPVYIIHNQS